MWTETTSLSLDMQETLLINSPFKLPPSQLFLMQKAPLPCAAGGLYIEFCTRKSRVVAVDKEFQYYTLFLSWNFYMECPTRGGAPYFL